MRIELSTNLPKDSDWVWARVRQSKTLEYVAAPLISFVPKHRSFPDIWEEGDYNSSMKLFGFFPLGSQTIGIEYPGGKDGLVLRDNGHGTMAKVWDHYIFVKQVGGGTRYTDRVDVSAGFLTPFVALFARIFYAHRQRRWKKLARTT